MHCNNSDKLIYSSKNIGLFQGDAIAMIVMFNKKVSSHLVMGNLDKRSCYFVLITVILNPWLWKRLGFRQQRLSIKKKVFI